MNSHLYPIVQLKKGKEISIERRHPWIFSGAIFKKPELEEGQVVWVSNAKGQIIATAHYHDASIALRVLAFSKVLDLDAFLKSRIEAARATRDKLGLLHHTNTNGYRLIFGEGDFLPGLIIDIYHQTAILQAHTLGMHKLLPQIASLLDKAYDGALEVIFDKSKWQKLGLEANSAPYFKGGNHGGSFMENGIRFYADWENGQKTGFFLDQRDNRALLGRYAKHKKVLNTFCYTGGFSMYAIANEASLVHSVDSSERAISVLNKTVENSFPNYTNHQGICDDVFNFFKEHEENYDVIVLDPPAFAKSQKAKHRATMAYKRLNRVGIEHIKRGGILFTFSCSQVIDKYLFTNTVRAAAIEAGRNIRILHQLSQPADHPINLAHPEGEYLKGLVLQVD